MTTTNIDSMLRNTMEDSEGYYLLGYHPDEDTFSRVGGPQFHKIVVKVRRPVLRVRSRTGFFGIPDRKRAIQTPRAQIARAMTSPFAESGIHVRLTPLFSNEPKTGSFINAMLYIDGKDLHFTDEPDGWHKASFDVVTMLFGDNGQAADTTDKTYTIRARDKTYELALTNGVVYSVAQSIKKPGAYQLRVVVRDVNSDQVGSASQFVAVPDLAKGRLALSSIRLSEQAPVADPNGSAAVRLFKPRATISYNFLIFNAAHANRPPELDVRTQLFRDGRQVYTDQRPMTQAKVLTDSTQLVVEESMRLGTDLTSGDYLLQVTVKDKAVTEKYRTAAQAMDFEVE